MYIKITDVTEEKSWYKGRIGNIFKVIKESVNIDGEKMFIVYQGKIMDSFVLAKDCVIMKECYKCGHLMLPDDHSECSMR